MTGDQLGRSPRNRTQTHARTTHIIQTALCDFSRNEPSPRIICSLSVADFRSAKVSHVPVTDRARSYFAYSRFDYTGKRRCRTRAASGSAFRRFTRWSTFVRQLGRGTITVSSRYVSVVHSRQSDVATVRGFSKIGTSV